MRKFAKPFSAIAMLLVVVICFSGCGIVDFTRSIFHKENKDISVNIGNPEVNGDVTANNQTVTDSASVVPPSTQAQTHTPVTNNGGATSTTSKPAQNKF